MSKKLSKLIIVMLLLCNTIAACTPNVNNISGNASDNLITPFATEQVSSHDPLPDDESQSTTSLIPSSSTSALTPTPQPALEPSVAPPSITQDLTVHFLDVGQADSIFIELPNDETMLIDAGNAADDDYIIDYVKDSGHETLNYLVATHPHEDHIGGMASVIKTFEIGSIYMPKVSANTRTFEDLLLAIQEKGHTIKTAKAGVSIIDADILKVEIIAPNSTTYDDLNDYSTVVKIIYGSTSFLFMGDAETVSENEITTDVNVDVMKVGHHGSSSSTGQAFLDKVTPKYAIISVGADNSYGHPTKEILDRLEDIKANVYRTDENGTIVITSDGSDISVKVTKEMPVPTPTPTPPPPPPPTPPHAYTYAYAFLFTEGRKNPGTVHNRERYKGRYSIHNKNRK